MDSENPRGGADGLPEEERPERPRPTIREPRVSDLPYVRGILEEWIRDSVTGEVIPAEVTEVLLEVEQGIEESDGQWYLVAEDDRGDIVGLMGLQAPDIPMRRQAVTTRPAELINAYVANGKQRSGVGSELVQRLEKLAVNSGATEVIVNSGPRYAHTGWLFWTRMYGEPAGELEDYYGPGAHAKVWRKSLMVERPSYIPPAERAVTTEQLTREAFAKLKAGVVDREYHELVHELTGHNQTPAEVEGALLRAGADLLRNPADTRRRDDALAYATLRLTGGVELRPIGKEIIEHCEGLTDDAYVREQLDMLLLTARGH